MVAKVDGVRNKRRDLRIKASSQAHAKTPAERFPPISGLGLSLALHESVHVC